MHSLTRLFNEYREAARALHAAEEAASGAAIPVGFLTDYIAKKEIWEAAAKTVFICN